VTYPAATPPAPTDPSAAAPATDPVLQRVAAATSGVHALAGQPLGEITTRLDALHSELQAALVEIDNDGKN